MREAVRLGRLHQVEEAEGDDDHDTKHEALSTRSRPEKELMSD